MNRAPLLSRHPLLLLAAALLLALSLTACEKKTDPKSSSGSVADDPTLKVLVEVNGTPITQADLDFWLTRGHRREFTQEEREKTLERLIEAELIFQQGLKLGLDDQARYKMAVRRQELQLKAMQRGEMMRQVYNKVVLNEVNVTEEETRAFFDQNQAILNTEWHLASVAFQDAIQAEKAAQQLKQGKTFEELASDIRTPPTSATGRPAWDLGYMDWIRIPTEWQEAVTNLQPGQVSGIVHGEKTGIRIFKLLEKREKAGSDFGRLRGGIMMRLREAKVKQTFEDFKSKLRTEAKINRS